MPSITHKIVAEGYTFLFKYSGGNYIEAKVSGDPKTYLVKVDPADRTSDSIRSAEDQWVVDLLKRKIPPSESA
jgi:hypothetical protein